MENIGDYLYLVVIVVIGLISALKRKKAVKVRQPELESDDSEIFDTDEADEYIGGDRKYSIEAEDDFWKEVVDIETDIKEIKPVFFNSESEGTFGEPLAAAFSNEGISALNIEKSSESRDISEKSMINSDFPESLDEESIGGRIGRDFNLQEAIVYSEIINRREDF